MMDDRSIYPDSPTKSPVRQYHGGGGYGVGGRYGGYHSDNPHSAGSSGASSPVKMIPLENGSRDGGGNAMGGSVPDSLHHQGEDGNGHRNGPGQASDQDLVDYTEGEGGSNGDGDGGNGVGPMSPMRRVNAIIPETIPE